MCLSKGRMTIHRTLFCVLLRREFNLHMIYKLDINLRTIVYLFAKRASLLQIIGIGIFCKTDCLVVTRRTSLVDVIHVLEPLFCMLILVKNFTVL